MNFNNATVLSVSKKSEFFGDVLRYKTIKQLNVEGLVLNLTNTDGVSGVLSGMQALAIDSANWQPVILNGYNFGTGLISNINFSEGRDVQYKTYNVTISIPESGDISSITGAGNYSGLNYTNFRYIDGFSETSNFSRTLNVDTYTQNLKFNIKGPYSLDSVSAAKSIAQNFFSSNTLTGLSADGLGFYGNTTIRQFRSESYDSGNGVYNFSRNFHLNRNSTGDYSLTRIRVLDFDAQGVLLVKEKAEYLGHTQTPFETIFAQATTDISGAYGRCTGILSLYSNIVGEASLINQPITKSFNTIPFEGKLNYEIAFSNALRVTSFNSYWDRTINSTRSLGNVYSMSEQGSIVGVGHMIDAKYNNALNAWNTNIYSGISSRLSGYYSGSRALRLMSESTTYEKVQGKINYSRKYTDSDSLLATTDIRKATIVVSKESNRHISTPFSLFNNKEIVQLRNNLLPNQISYNINMNGASTTSIDTYLSRAKSYISLPSDTSTSYLSSCDYKYDPFSRNFSLNASITSLPVPSAEDLSASKNYPNSSPVYIS